VIVDDPVIMSGGVPRLTLVI